MATEKKTTAVVMPERIAPSVSPKGTVTPVTNGHVQDKTSNRSSDLKKKGTTTVATIKKERADKPSKSASKKAGTPKATKSLKKKVQIHFQLRYSTVFGQDLYIMGNHPALGNNQPDKAMAMHYFNENYWVASLVLEEFDTSALPITYHYVLKNADGTIQIDWGNDKCIQPALFLYKEVYIHDSWNFAGYFENTFYTEPFTKVLLKANQTLVPTRSPKKVTHVLKVKSPLLEQGQTLCLLGSDDALCNWDTTKPLLLSKNPEADCYAISLDLSKVSFPLAYKYGVYDTKEQRFLRYEEGNNRVLYESAATGKQYVYHDGFAVLPNNTWKGAGVAIPVFSLRTAKSFGVGEFTDLKLLVDWSKRVGLKMIQLLPINDTTATLGWTDSYPYAAISAFALHPIYLHLEALLQASDKKLLDTYQKEQQQLNDQAVVDYVAVMAQKKRYTTAIYQQMGKKVLASKDFQQYFSQNKHWLESYAAFCYLRDQYGTVDFNQWPLHHHYNAKAIAKLTSKDSNAYEAIALHYFIQYQLHLQLKEATQYAHDNGIIVKGDIAIGVYRHGADAWQHPDLYHMEFQAGAPPDDFAVTGQNWGFPTYNWEAMRKDGFAWWKQRFEQMGDYFDAFRIDHILGFFRIWSIPMHAVEGIMGHFDPAIPVHINEIHARGISFDLHRFTQPYITENVLWELFGYDNELVKKEFLTADGYGQYTLKENFRTQRAVEAYFATLETDEHHQKVQQGLYHLISNVLLFAASENDTQHFHFRFGMESTSSFRYLDAHSQAQLKELYIDYFFRRQDDFWKKEALLKLPALKRVTNMMVCGEDLGMVPSCVPDVMRQLGLLSLEIQRMPKDPNRNFFHPSDAPYLSVVTPSTHDMSTIRGWWEEDKTRIQQFYNHELGQWGDAPFYCEAWINKAIILQHLYAPAMWSVFQLQDLLGMDARLRRENPHEERINIPADPKHYWQYRMHLSIEALIEEAAFNDELKGYLVASGR